MLSWVLLRLNNKDQKILIRSVFGVGEALSNMKNQPVVIVVNKTDQEDLVSAEIVKEMFDFAGGWFSLSPYAGIPTYVFS